MNDDDLALRVAEIVGLARALEIGAPALADDTPQGARADAIATVARSVVRLAEDLGAELAARRE